MHHRRRVVHPMYTTDSFTVQLRKGMHTFFDYDYDTNAIFALPTKDLKDSTLIQAFDQVFTELEEEGHKHKFNVTNDQATKPIEEFPKTKDCK